MSVVKTSISERSPLSPTRWPADAFIWWQSLLFAFALVAIIFVSGIPVLIAMVATGTVNRQELTGTHFNWVLFDVSMVSYVLPFAAMLLVVPRLAHRSLADLGLRWPRSADLTWGLTGAIAMFVIANLAGALETALFHVKPDEAQVHWLHEMHGALLVALVFLACICAPIFEEFAFRGFIFNALLRYLPLWLAVVLSSALFGLAHGVGQPGNSGALFPLAAGGAVLALVYYYSRSLTASMITHATFNLFTVVLVVAFHQS
jgi:membrane protease YdiL (CAAX protease family)